MKRLTQLFLLLACLALPGLANAAPTARVKVAFVEMSRADVRRLAIVTPAVGRFRNDLKNLEAAANRRGFHYGVTSGPTVRVGTGQTQIQGVADISAIRVRGRRAYVRVRILNTQNTGADDTRAVAATHVYRSGETRLIAALPAPDGRYRYTFATVTVSP